MILERPLADHRYWEAAHRGGNLDRRVAPGVRREGQGVQRFIVLECIIREGWNNEADGIALLHERGLGDTIHCAIKL